MRFGVGVSWVYVSMHVYGLMPVILAGAATAAFCAYLAVYPALALGLAHRVFSSVTWRLAVGLPVLWMLTEWLRGTVFTGFPWLASGYAHTDGPLAGWAPTLGMYGITLMAALLAGALSLLTLPTRHYGWVAAAFVTSLSVDGRPYAVGPRAGSPISVRLVQANVPQNLKFEPDGIARAFTAHLALMQAPSQAQAVDLVALPESIFPVPIQHVPPQYLQAFRDFAQQNRTAVIYGVFLEEPRGTLTTVPSVMESMRHGRPSMHRYSTRPLGPSRVHPPCFSGSR